MKIYQVTAEEDPAFHDAFFPTLKRAKEYVRLLKANDLEPTDIRVIEFTPTRDRICDLLTDMPHR